MAESYDVSVVSYVLHNPEIYSEFLHRFEIPFGDKTVGKVWTIIQRVWEKYSRFPSERETVNIIQTHSAFTDKDDLRELYIDITARVYDSSAHSDVTREVLLHRILEIYKWKMKEDIDHVTVDNMVEKHEELIQQMEKLKQMIHGESDEVFFTFEERNIDRADELLEETLGEPMPTGLPGWDSWLHGGFRRKESAMMIGLTNDGKTAICAGLSINGVRGGYRAVVYALDSPLADLCQRVWANVSGVGIEDDRERCEFNTRLKRNVNPNWRHRHIIRSWSRGSRSVDDLRRDLEYVRKQCRKADLAAGVHPDDAGHIDQVYIDYGDCLTPSRRSKENWIEAAGVFSELDSVSKDFNCFLFAPTQAKISSNYMDVIDMTQACAAWGKNFPVQFVIGLCRTPQEREEGLGRLYLDKTKRKRGKYLVPVYIDNDLMRIGENGTPYYASAMQSTPPPQPQRYEKKKKEEKPITKDAIDREEQAVKPIKRRFNWRIPSQSEEVDPQDVIAALRGARKEVA